MSETTQTLEVSCAYDDCENTGERYNDGENFEREHFGHHGPSTVCQQCGRSF